MKINNFFNIFQMYTEYQYQTGCLYYFGLKGIKKDIQKARYYFEKAASKEHIQAQFYLGYIYITEQELEDDSQEGFELVKKSALKGFKEAEYLLGYIYYFGKEDCFKNIVPKDPEISLKWFEKASKQGHAKALYYLGSFYLDGIAIEKNIKKGLELLEESVSKGFHEAEHLLGLLFYSGKEDSLGNKIAKDYLTAFKWFEKSSYKGNIRSFYYLGVMHLYGFGTEQNTKIGFDLIENSAMRGYHEAQFLMGYFYHNGLKFDSHNVVEQNYQSSVDWYNFSASQGNTNSLYNLGLLYINGQGVKEDVKKGTELIKEAASKGHIEAQEYFIKPM